MTGAWRFSSDKTSSQPTGNPWGTSASEQTLEGKSNSTSMDKLGSNNSVLKTTTLSPPGNMETLNGETVGTPTSNHTSPSVLTRPDIEEPYRPSDNEYVARRRRLLLRLFQLFSSGACLSFLVSATPFSKLTRIPYDNPSIIYYEYVAASISVAWSFICLMSIAFRRLCSSRKINRWLLVISDGIVTMLWIVFLVVMMKTPACFSDGDRGWCAFFYTSIAFAFIAAFCSCIGFLWSLFGSCCQ